MSTNQKFSFMLCSDCKNDTFGVMIIGSTGNEVLALVCTRCKWSVEIHV